MSKQKRIRPLGDILLELEATLDEMVDDHELQFGDVLGLVHTHLTVHRPDAQEEYLDGGRPVFFYGYRKENNDS